MRWWLLLLLFAGCFPYRQVYRPAFDGLVLDGAGRPAAHVPVEACSATHWNHACRYHANTVTDDAGRFHFSEKKEWDWCCLGEAPLPYTVIAACAPDGHLASGRVYGRPEEPYQMVLAATTTEEWARRACAR